MTPYLGTVAGYPIPIFAVALDLALVAGLWTAVSLAARRGFAATRLLDAALWVLLAALAGSRAWYVAFHWSDYASQPLAVFAFWEGGLALPGAVIAGALALVATARASRLTLGPLADSAAIGAALGQAIGRLGCIPAGCAAGKPVQDLPAWLPTLLLPDAAGVLAVRFPSQLVEAAAEFLLAVALWCIWASRARAGRVAITYLAGYAAIRLAASPFRA